MKTTYEEFDCLQEQLEKIPNQVPGWLPSEKELENHASKNPERFIEFLLWLTFTAAPTTDDGKTRLRALNRFLYEKIVFAN